jgi:rhodanese-related sulfurtransferase
VNRRGPHLYGPGEPALPRLTADAVARLHAAGAWIIDARPIEAFAEGHVPGSVSIVLRPQFASWLGWGVPDGAPLVFVLERDQDRAEAIRQARNIGYETLLGELGGGIDAWRASGHAVATVPLAHVEQSTGPVIDVRQRSEYEAGHLPTARNVETGAVSTDAIPPGPVSMMCGHGERAMTAASLLAREGRHDVTVLVGGPDDWARQHGRLDTGR